MLALFNTLKKCSEPITPVFAPVTTKLISRTPPETFLVPTPEAPFKSKLQAERQNPIVRRCNWNSQDT